MMWEPHKDSFIFILFHFEVDCMLGLLVFLFTVRVIFIIQ